jgi:RHS repeat-associated protein
VYFYGPNGKLLTVVQVSFNPTAPYVTATTLSNRIYFGKTLLGTTNGHVNTDSSLIKDRLGSVQPSYAYGTDTGSGQQTSPGDDFATYMKDSSTGFEYAMNRYYSTGYGRFLTVDPFGGSASADEPGTWNRYAYTAGDPVNRLDATGAFSSGGGGDGAPAADGSNDTICDASDFFLMMEDPVLGHWDVPELGAFDNAGCGGLSPFSIFGLTDSGGSPLGFKDRMRDLKWMSASWQQLKTFSGGAANSPCENDLKTLAVTDSIVDKIGGGGTGTTLADIRSLAPADRSQINPGADFVAVPSANEIVYNIGQFWQTSYSEMLGTLLHEIVHLAQPVLTDTQMQTALGRAGAVDPTNTSNISTTLANDCFKGAQAPSPTNP